MSNNINLLLMCVKALAYWSVGTGAGPLPKDKVRNGTERVKQTETEVHTAQPSLLYLQYLIINETLEDTRLLLPWVNLVVGVNIKSNYSISHPQTVS